MRDDVTVSPALQVLGVVHAITSFSQICLALYAQWWILDRKLNWVVAEEASTIVSAFAPRPVTSATGIHETPMTSDALLCIKVFNLRSLATGLAHGRRHEVDLTSILLNDVLCSRCLPRSKVALDQ
jgi:hypothetical protein